MDRLDNLIIKLSEFETTSMQLVKQTIRENEAFILALNYEDQLYDKGINRYSVKIQPPYAESTLRRKRNRNQTTSHVTLRDEGVFHKSFVIDYRADCFKIMTTDPVEVFLVARYGPEILGLTNENTNYIATTFVMPIILEHLKNII